MPIGERSTTWFKEIIATLREAWLPELSWDEVMALREQLQEQLVHIRASRNIKPPMFHCHQTVGWGSRAIPGRAFETPTGNGLVAPAFAICMH